MENMTRSRRTFIKSAAATSVVVGFVGFDGVARAAAAAPAAPADLRRRAFTIDYDESVHVNVTAGRRFELTVTDADGNVLEHRRNLSVRRLLLLRSEHFTARAIEPPS